MNERVLRKNVNSILKDAENFLSEKQKRLPAFEVKKEPKQNTTSCRKEQDEMISAENLSILQGIYYLITGIWPLIHIGSFMKITGPKTDRWLVKTVGVLLAVISLVYLTDGLRNEIRLSTFLLAFGCALGIEFDRDRLRCQKENFTDLPPRYRH